MAEHLSRKELKQDKVKETIEHGAAAVYSHAQLALAALLAILVVVACYGGWRIYSDRKTAQATASLDTAMKAYSARIGAPIPGQPVDPSEPTFNTESDRSQDAYTKFLATADKYPGTRPGKLARYYAALCLEDLDRHNEALEQLKKVTSDGDKELASMAQYQTATIDARTGNPDQAIALYRSLADHSSVFVPRPLVLLELAALLRQKNPQEATTLYQQIKKEFPSPTIADEADRGLDSIAPKS